MYRNERHRLTPFIRYYRELGVNHFIFLDNESTDGGLDGSEFAAASDISVFLLTQNFGESRQGTDWINAFLNKYCRGHWTLAVDMDEYFVYPHSERRNLKDLTTYLTDAEQDAVWSLMIDMYPRGPIENIVFDENEYPIKQADHFDIHGYYCVAGGYKDTWVRGGPRLRKFFRDSPETSPALNKVPLIKWRFGYEYVLNQHALSPLRLNRPHGWHNHVTGAILHFKFDRQFAARVKEEVEREQHYTGSAEYKKYLAHYEKHSELDFIYPGSRAYQSTQTLVDAGLISAGIWS
jgi:hypothetical protein